MKNNKGFTLIEVILSIAIIGIIAIPILGIFGTGIKNIVRAGERTEDVFVEQKMIGNEINSGTIEGKDTDLEIIFTNDLKIIIKGKTVTSSEGNTKITTFVPER